MEQRVQISKLLRINIGILVIIPFVLLLLGVYHGLMQTIYRAGLLQDTSFAGLEYYQGLTLHGVINALVLTTFVAVAIGHYINAYFLQKEIPNSFTITSTALMIIGTLLAAWAMLAGEASVLYTFYPPLKAHPLFYLGTALLLVGSWLPIFPWCINYVRWKKENPDKIDWKQLSANPGAIELLEDNKDKINWKYLAKNPRAVHLFKMNPDKINIWD